MLIFFQVQDPELYAEGESDNFNPPPNFGGLTTPIKDSSGPHKLDKKCGFA